MRERLEIEYRDLIEWAMRECPIKGFPGSWAWDADEEWLFGQAGDRKWRFWVEVSVGRRRTYIAFLKVSGSTWEAEWEARVSEADARRAKARADAELADAERATDA